MVCQTDNQKKTSHFNCNENHPEIESNNYIYLIQIPIHMITHQLATVSDVPGVLNYKS